MITLKVLWYSRHRRSAAPVPLKELGSAADVMCVSDVSFRRAREIAIKEHLTRLKKSHASVADGSDIFIARYRCNRSDCRRRREASNDFRRIAAESDDRRDTYRDPSATPYTTRRLDHSLTVRDTTLFKSNPIINRLSIRHCDVTRSGL